MSTPVPLNGPVSFRDIHDKYSNFTGKSARELKALGNYQDTKASQFRGDYGYFPIGFSFDEVVFPAVGEQAGNAADFPTLCNLSLDGEKLIRGAVGVDDFGNNAGAFSVDFVADDRSLDIIGDKEPFFDPKPSSQSCSRACQSEDGLLLLIGSSIYSFDSNTFQGGAVALYKRNLSGGVPGSAVFQERLIAQESADRFGASLTCNRDLSLFAVGAPRRVVEEERRGEVRVYSYNTTQGISLQQIIQCPTDKGSFNNFGDSIDMTPDGRFLVIGASAQNNVLRFVQIFERINKQYVLQQTIDTPNDISSNDSFGGQVRISANGSILVIASEKENLDFLDQGAVYIYKRAGSVYDFSHKIIARSEFRNQSSRFGAACDISYNGQYLIIGASGTNVNGITGQGYVFVYSIDLQNQFSDLITSKTIEGGAEENDSYGNAVGISGNGQRFCSTALRGNLTAGSNTDEGYHEFIRAR